MNFGATGIKTKMVDVRNTASFGFNYLVWKTKMADWPPRGATPAYRLLLPLCLEEGHELLVAVHVDHCRGHNSRLNTLYLANS